MKTGLGLRKKARNIFAYYNLFKFVIWKTLFGFEYANILLQRVDKNSIQLILKKNGAQIGFNCDIETGLIFHNCSDYSNLIIGDNCHIGKNCFFDLSDKVVIGQNVVISMQCTFITHIDIGNSKLRNIYPHEKKKIIVCDDCYIGARSTILMGIKLNEKSIVAAGAVVIKNVEPHTLVSGVPAKKIKDLNINKS